MNIVNRPRKSSYKAQVEPNTTSAPSYSHIGSAGPKRKWPAIIQTVLATAFFVTLVYWLLSSNNSLDYRPKVITGQTLPTLEPHLPATPGDTHTTPTHGLPFPVPVQLGSQAPDPIKCCQQQSLNVQELQRGANPPRMMIIGVQKAATSYMASVLSQVPDFIKPMCPYGDIIGRHDQIKEFHFFDYPNYNTSVAQKYIQSWDYYATHKQPKVIKFEATPTYSIFSYVPCRIKKILPDTKIILFLREPTLRAISSFQMMYGKRQFDEAQSFADLISEEIARLRAANCTWQGADAALRKSWADCFPCQHLNIDGFKGETGFSTRCFAGALEPGDLSRWSDLGGNQVMRGMYAPMVAWWLQYFDKTQFMLVNLQQVERNSIAIANQISRFVGHKPVFTADLLVDGKGRKKNLIGNQHVNWREPTEHVRAEVERGREILREFYKPLNDMLYTLIDQVGMQFEKFDSDGSASVALKEENTD